MQTLKKVDAKFWHELGLQLRKERKRQGLKIYEVAKKMGYSRSLVNHWELGYSKMNAKQYKAYCNVLNIMPKINVHVVIDN
nr:MAG TPA: Helix-turn-helix XRE-family like protein [Bacteriophage sp.]